MCCGIWWGVREIDPGIPHRSIAPKDAFDCLADPMVATIGEGNAVANTTARNPES